MHTEFLWMFFLSSHVHLTMFESTIFHPDTNIRLVLLELEAFWKEGSPLLLKMLALRTGKSCGVRMNLIN